MTEEETMAQRFDAAIRVVEEIIRRPDEHPDEATVLLLSDAELSALFTRERLRILESLNERKFDSFTELAEHLGRDVSRVRKDVRILARAELVKTVRRGRKTRVEIGKTGLYIPIVQLRPLEKHPLLVH